MHICQYIYYFIFFRLLYIMLNVKVLFPIPSTNGSIFYQEFLQNIVIIEVLKKLRTVSNLSAKIMIKTCPQLTLSVWKLSGSENLSEFYLVQDLQWDFQSLTLWKKAKDKNECQVSAVAPIWYIFEDCIIIVVTVFLNVVLLIVF